MQPKEEYLSRLEAWRKTAAESGRESRRLGNARLATGLGGAAIAALALGATVISPWWLVLPFMIFAALAVVHAGVDRRRSAAQRAVLYYERCLGRVENRWAGHGSSGDAFRDPKHIYADDLDLFGRGSLFELLSDARTGVGERTLAGWLLAPCDIETARARQQAIAELRPRLDLREEMALIGNDIRAAIDDRVLAEWGAQPPVHFFPGARWVALLLAAAGIGTLTLWLAQLASVVPFLIVVLAELLFGFFTREDTLRVVAAVATPSSELKLIGLVLARLEKESLTSPHLVQLTRQLDEHKLTASAEIRRLQRWIELLDWTRNQFFRPIAAPVLWVSQVAMAVEAWRQDCGPHVAQWVAAVGEFEALCSLARFAYERPASSFPEFIPQNTPLFEAEAVAHPMIDPASAVANDVRLGGECTLWIVSGSNMSGKSTLLRAVGLNAVLALAGAPVTCARLRISPLRVGASIRVNDSLTDNRSRFYAEIIRLREIVDLAQQGQPTLFLLDELLSGTNSHDRRIGAAALIRSLVERGAMGLVTTHDLALVDIAGTPDGHARNVHFEDHLEGGEIRFDYRLREGVVERSNALELMRAVGLDV